RGKVVPFFTGRQPAPPHIPRPHHRAVFAIEAVHVTNRSYGEHKFVGDHRGRAHPARRPTDVAHPIRTGVPSRAPALLPIVSIETSDGFSHATPLFRPCDHHIITRDRRRAPTLSDRRAPLDRMAVRGHCEH